MGFDFIVVVSLLPSCCSLFVFVDGGALFGRFQCPPVDGSSTVSCDFDALAGGYECTSFCSTIS